MPLRVLVPLVLLTSLATACDTILGPARLGLSLTEAGRPVILYAPCPGEEIDRIMLAVVRDNLGGSDDQILWEIQATSSDIPAGLVEVVPGGSVPAGFRISVPLEAPLPSASTLTAAVFTAEGMENANSFKPRQLRAGKILTDIDSHVSETEFLALAEDTCDNKLDN